MIRVLNKMIRIALLSFIFPLALISQNLSKYYKLIESGKIADVRKDIPELISRYPKSAEVLYLSGLVENDGEKALLIFKDVLSKYPNSPSAPKALLKINEYLYTKGLYRQTGKYTKQLLKRYPESGLIEEAIPLLAGSFRVRNMKDSADYYIYLYDEMYSELHIAEKFIENQDKYTLSEVAQGSSRSSNIINTNRGSRTTAKQYLKKKNLYSIQIGAFSVTANAYGIKDDLKARGYDAFIHQIKSKEKTLFAVRVGGFVTKAEAERFGKLLKKKEKMNYIIVYN